MANEASGAAEEAAYECGVLEIETRLAEEVVRVCRNYCTEVWAEALNQARVPTNSELRRTKNTYFLEDIREVPAMLPPSVVDPFPPPERLSTIQAPSLDAKVSIRADKVKEVQPSTKFTHFEDTLTIRDMVTKAKDEETKSKSGDTQLKVVDPNEDHHQAKA